MVARNIKNANKRLFLVEDDENFGSVLKAYLEMSQYEVLWHKTGGAAQKHFQTDEFDICIFDVMLPGIDGFSLAQELRKQKPLTPFIFLTARKLKEDVIKGFQLGADDYITKPFDSEILLYKIEAILNRAEMQPGLRQVEVFEFGQSTFDFRLRQLKVPGKEYKLSPKEAALLKMLCQHLNDILPRDKALNEIWKNNDYFTTRSMDVFVTKIRKYLSLDPSLEIVSIHGSGFQLLVKD